MKKVFDKKISLFFIGLILGLFLINFVAAQNVIFDPIKSLFLDWGEGDLSVNVAKYLFFFILTILVYSVISLVPTLKTLAEPLKWLLSFLIGFLAAAYITPSDVYAVVAGYSAMGIVMGAILPFIILLFFSIEVSKEGGVGGIIAGKLIWFGFIIMLIYKLISGTGQEIIEPWMTWTYVGVIVAAILYILVLEKYVYKWLFKTEKDTTIKILQEDLTLQQLKRKAEAQSARDEIKNKT